MNYDLRVYRKMIPAGGGEAIEGPLRIEGRVWHPTDELFRLKNVGKYFTLSLRDGRKFDFFFRDQNGSVANCGVGLYTDPVPSA